MRRVNEFLVLDYINLLDRPGSDDVDTQLRRVVGLEAVAHDGVLLRRVDAKVHDDVVGSAVRMALANGIEQALRA